MITYRSLSRTPVAFKSLSGLTVTEFDALCREWYHADQVARASATLTRDEPHPRERAPGAGRKWRLDAPTRLLLTLVWLKLYPTWDVLGFLFGAHPSMVRRCVKDVLARLQESALFPLEKREARKQGRSLADVVQACPTVEVIVDSHEQRIRRPKGWPNQEPFYSGKKKTHTLKAQAAVSLDGRVLAVSESVPGSTSDLALLDESGVVEKMGDEEALAGDKAYTGAEKRHPNLAVYVPDKKPPNGELTPEEKSYNQAHSRMRIVVEHLFARMMRFGVMAQVYRHARTTHSSIFRVLAWLADRKIAAHQATSAVCA